MGLDIDLPDECIREICTSGHNDLAVWQWAKILSKEIVLKEAKQVVKESGLDCTGFTDIDYKQYALWLSAWDESGRFATKEEIGEET